MRKSVHVLRVRRNQSAWLYPRMRLIRHSNGIYTKKLYATKPLRHVGNITNWHGVLSRKVLIFMNKAPETSHYTEILWVWNWVSSYNFEPYRSYSYIYTDVCRTCLCTRLSSAKEFFSLISLCLNLRKSRAACWIPPTCFTSCYHKTFMLQYI
jgi:hypothetical protein